MDNTLKSSLDRIILAGVGALGYTTEKSKELFEQLVQKGELTVEQAKNINEELKHNKETQAGQASAGAKSSQEPAYADILQKLETLSSEEIALLRTKLDELTHKD